MLLPMLDRLQGMVRRLRGKDEEQLAPLASGRLPLIGHARALGREPLALLDRARRQHGDVFRLELHGRPVLVALGPCGAELAARSFAPLGDERYRLRSGLMDAGLLWEAEPQLPPTASTIVDTLLSPGLLRPQVERMAEGLRQTLASWPEEGELAVATDAFALACDLILPTFFGADRAAEARQIFEAQLPELEQHLPPLLSQRPAAALVDRTARRFERGRELLANTEAALSSLVAGARAARGGQALTLLSALPTKLPAKAAAKLVARLCWCAVRQTAALLPWSMIDLCRQPRLREALYEEQDLLHGDQGDPTFETVRQAQRLSAWLADVERRHPPRLLALTDVTSDLVCAGYRASAGSLLLLAPGWPEPAPPAPLTPVGLRLSNAVAHGLGELALLAAWSVFLRQLELELLVPPIEGWQPHGARLRFRLRES